MDAEVTAFAYDAVDILPSEELAVLAGPLVAQAPKVGLSMRTGDGRWSELFPVPSIGDRQVASCDLASATEMYCHVSVGNGLTTDIVRIAYE